MTATIPKKKKRRPLPPRKVFTVLKTFKCTPEESRLFDLVCKRFNVTLSEVARSGFTPLIEQMGDEIMEMEGVGDD